MGQRCDTKRYSLILIDTKPIDEKSFHAGYHRLLNSLFCSSIFKTKTPQILNLQGISKLVHRGACPAAPGPRPFLPCCTFPLCGLVLPCCPADRMEVRPPPPPPPASHEPTVTRGWWGTNQRGPSLLLLQWSRPLDLCSGRPHEPPRHLPRHRRPD